MLEMAWLLPALLVAYFITTKNTSVVWKIAVTALCTVAIVSVFARASPLIVAMLYGLTGVSISLWLIAKNKL